MQKVSFSTFGLGIFGLNLDSSHKYYTSAPYKNASIHSFLTKILMLLHVRDMMHAALFFKSNKDALIYFLKANLSNDSVVENLSNTFVNLSRVSVESQ